MHINKRKESYPTRQVKKHMMEKFHISSRQWKRYRKFKLRGRRPISRVDRLQLAKFDFLNEVEKLENEKGNDSSLLPNAINTSNEVKGE